MNHQSSLFTVPDDAPDFARRFAMIMAGLGALVARRFLKMPHLSGFTILLFSRLNRAVWRLYRALIAPGKARAPRLRTTRIGDARAHAPGLPSGRGWLVRELGWEAAGYLSQLEALLNDVGARTALAKAPGAARILRPICRMLGVQAAVMAVVAAPRAPSAAPEVLASVVTGDDIAAVPGLIFSGA